MKSCLIILLAIFMLGVCSATLATTWPQNFSLSSGATATYTFDVTSEGVIVIDITWQGGGLTALLKDPSGTIVNNPPTAKPSPINMTYTATAAHIQKGKQWTLTIYPPPMPNTGNKPAATGTVNVKVPVPGIVILPGTGGLRTLPGTPSIQSVTPNYGSPMGTVTIKGKNIPDDKTKADVWFELAANTPTQGTIISASKALDIVTYQVRVPGNDYLYNSHQGPLYVKVRDTGAVTNNLPFTFEPCPAPVITSHSPQCGKPGAVTVFQGTNFKSTDRVHFITPSGDVTSPQTVFHSATEITATLPVDYPKDSKTITMYVRYDCKGHSFNSGQYKYPLDPSVVNAKPK